MSITPKQTSTKQFGNIEDHQYLTFMLGEEVFAISAITIKEIISYSNVTKVPSMNDYVEGITNVRGNVIPVVSLSHRFGLPCHQPTSKTCIIIVSVIFDNDKSDVGLVVDRVDQVHDIFAEDMEDIPSFGTKVKKEFLLKIGKVDGRFISILNNDTILDLDDLSKVKVQRHYRRRFNDR